MLEFIATVGVPGFIAIFVVVKQQQTLEKVKELQEANHNEHIEMLKHLHIICAGKDDTKK